MTTATGFVSPEEERRLRQLTAAEDTQGQETSELRHLLQEHNPYLWL